jgi:hypothetical protein
VPSLHPTTDDVVLDMPVSPVDCIGGR